MPERIQRKRTKGWRMPENTVYVGRGTKWGNPYRVSYNPYTRFWEVRDANNDLSWVGYKTFPDKKVAAIQAMNCYTKSLHDLPRSLTLARPLPFSVDDALKELSGKNLACWCPPDQACHADVLLELANKEQTR